jgi:hypothetical protein
VLPGIDHGRVHFFLLFWSECEQSPVWLRKVCMRLAYFNWGRGAVELKSCA